MKQWTSTENNHPWCLIFPSLQAENPKIVTLTNLHFLLHAKKEFRNIQRKIRNTSLISSVGGCLLAEGWQGVCFTQHCSLQPVSSRASTGPVTMREEHLYTWCLYGRMTCLLPWLPQQVERGACQGPIYSSRLALPPKGRQALPQISAETKHWAQIT